MADLNNSPFFEGGDWPTSPYGGLSQSPAPQPQQVTPQQPQQQAPQQGQPPQIQKLMQDVVHSVAAYHAAKAQMQQQGAPGTQSGAAVQPPAQPQGQPSHAALQPIPQQDPMMAQQQALHGAPPQQPQGQPAGPPQPYGAPSSMGQRGPLPQGVTMQRGEPTQEFPGGVTRYNGVFPQQGQQQPAIDPRQQQRDSQLQKLASPVTTSEAQQYMMQLGIGNPVALQRYAPVYAQFLQKQRTEQFKMALDLHKSEQEDQYHAAVAQKAQADAELARRRAVTTGTREDIERAKILGTLANKYMKDNAGEAPVAGGWLGGKKEASPEYAQAQKDATASRSTLRNAPKAGSEPDTAAGDEAPMEGAKQAPDGNWYVEKGGKYFKVEQ